MDNKKKTAIIIVCCILAVALIAFLIWKMLHQNNEETSSSDAVDGDDFPLQEGSQGEKVEVLQEYLNTQLMKMQNGEVKPSLLDVDGIFGAKTATACKAVFGTESISQSQFNEI